MAEQEIEQCENCGTDLDGVEVITSPDGNEWCELCYVNDECPFECNVQHDVPSDGSGRSGNGYNNNEYDLECGNTLYWMGDRRFRFGEWQETPTVMISAGEHYGEYVDEYDTFECYGCGELFHQDDYYEDSYCRECYRENYGGSNGYPVGPASTTLCRNERCANGVTHVDPLTERATCSTHAGPGYFTIEEMVTA